tara:strand:- start:1141 stop:1425 length:285 start_codon:yes stop_codon:yes gene_type:complete
MNLAVIGSGGREHAICYKLKQSNKIKKLICIPGNAGTYEKNNKIYSNGGRVLNVTSVSKSLVEARNESIKNINKINWNDGFFRKDIGWRLINKK